ncbi:hypothetical protein BJX99DRAFT_233948 [Aspergillus californicus]
MVLSTLCPSIRCLACKLLSAVNKTSGGLFSIPVRSNRRFCTVFPKSYCTTPPRSPVGLPTTTSPNRISCRSLGAPPPIPIIKPNLMRLKVANIWFTTRAAETVPVTPYGRHAITVLWDPTRPRT